ncbi:isoprenylcysteine carboxylmethyltransferase family protein [Pasteurella atlantica]|uniref:Isoprenylcysteine carboxylmethyltransferase family protein n=2 Tax=Pasteurellaceae TaxID=712 RepID=A0ACC6HK98_9PAST|nr:isoprenylcysteine carboxylmethyltransferase family protein [Pasteurella atlantica]MDP8034248.1 isoprenylcysteine carboxylmethyltransferase family protein [Pasteurella atlantica]MDP8036181.1 isoprenylcysteine carboxylmethyltransferase family protein [Pasteurella atlantica]MDP8038131.1 isoprenylcysteine carboxylmethyltransferase family protein [Pasteurella atlantica]MDP8048486.1 isoprenylcysteine carboxylmethyltransferase family protein [Pasteurella atlantica]MDP8050449.1 isoprenylcysteine ca
MELKIPPPVIFLSCALLMKFMPKWGVFNCHISIIIVVICVAIIIDIMSLWGFFKEKTTASPFNPNKTSTLVTYGIYSITRNPMYLSLAMYLFAWGLWLGNSVSLVGIVLFCLYITYFQIYPEERYLEKQFGEMYRQYKKRVRRWI